MPSNMIPTLYANRVEYGANIEGLPQDTLSMDSYGLSTMDESELEDMLIEAFKRGLETAVDEADGVTSDEDLDSISKQKLMLKGIRHFGLEEKVTVQWYLDGDMLHKFNDDEEREVTDSEEIPDIDDIVDYYLNGMDPSLQEILREDTFDWLKQYYDDNDTPFKEIYLLNMEIHLHIKQCTEACYSDTEEFPEDLVTPLTTAVDDMKKELIRYPLFRNLSPFWTEFNRVAGTTLSWFEENELGENEDYEEFGPIFKQLDEFYYEGVWKPVASRIAYYTVSGPSEEVSRDYRKEDLGKANFTFRQEFNAFMECTIESGANEEIEEINTDRLPKLRPEERGIDRLLEWDTNDSIDKDDINDLDDDDPLVRRVAEP